MTLASPFFSAYAVFLLRTANLWRMKLRAVVPLGTIMVALIALCSVLPWLQVIVAVPGNPFCGFPLGSKLSYAILSVCVLFDVVNFALLALKLSKPSSFKHFLRCLFPQAKSNYDHEDISRMLLQKTGLFVGVQILVLITLAILYTRPQQSFQVMQVAAFHAISISLAGRIFRRSWRLTREYSPTNVNRPPDYSSEWLRRAPNGLLDGSGANGGDAPGAAGRLESGNLGQGLDKNNTSSREKMKTLLEEDAFYVEGELKPFGSIGGRKSSSSLAKSRRRPTTASTGGVASSSSSASGSPTRRSLEAPPAPANNDPDDITIEMGPPAGPLMTENAAQTVRVTAAAAAPHGLPPPDQIQLSNADMSAIPSSYGPSLDASSGPSSAFWTGRRGSLGAVNYAASRSSDAGPSSWHQPPTATPSDRPHTSGGRPRPMNIRWEGLSPQDQGQLARAPTGANYDWPGYEDPSMYASHYDVAQGSTADTLLRAPLPSPTRSARRPSVPTIAEDEVVSSHHSDAPGFMHAVEDDEDPLQAFHSAVQADEGRPIGSPTSDEGRPRTSRGAASKSPPPPFGGSPTTTAPVTSAGPSSVPMQSLSSAGGELLSSSQNEALSDSSILPTSEPSGPQRPTTSHGPRDGGGRPGSFATVQTPTDEMATASQRPEPSLPSSNTTEDGASSSLAIQQEPTANSATSTTQQPSAIDEAYRRFEQLTRSQTPVSIASSTTTTSSSSSSSSSAESSHTTSSTSSEDTIMPHRVGNALERGPTGS